MTGFDFAAMVARGNSAGIAELYLMIMTPLPSDRAVESAAGAPSALEVHYA